MKSLIKYINEEFSKYQLNNVEVAYDILPHTFYLTAPEFYQESDIEQYLSDYLLQKLPGAMHIADQYFGNNTDSIYDVYFSWNAFEHITMPIDEDSINLPFEPRYDFKNSGSNVKLDVFKLDNPKYNIKFDRFEILNGSDENVRNSLVEIFRSAESNSINKYPIQIKLNTNILKYTK